MWLVPVKHTMNIGRCYYCDYYYHFLWSLVPEVMGEDETQSLAEGSALEKERGTGRRRRAG